MCVVRPTVAWNKTDERFLCELVSPIAEITSMTTIHRGDALVVRIELASHSSACNVVCFLQNKTFEWGCIEFISPQVNSPPRDRFSRLPGPTTKQPKSSGESGHYYALPGFQNEPVSTREKLLEPEAVRVKTNSNGISSKTISFNPKDIIKSPSTSYEDDVRLNFEQSNDQQTVIEPSLASSKVIFLQFLDKKFINAKTLSNILGCFGNVIRVVIDNQNKLAFGEFESPADVTNSIAHLNGTPFFGSDLLLSPVPDAFDLDQFVHQNSASISTTHIMPRFWRFRNRFRVKVNPPSNLLHITSIDSQADLVFIYSIISLIQEPETIYLLRKRSKESKMYLVKFATANQALEVLALLHDKVIGAKMLKVSFSKMDL
jgi:hypothetical protein